MKTICNNPSIAMGNHEVDSDFMLINRSLFNPSYHRVDIERILKKTSGVKEIPKPTIEISTNLKEQAKSSTQFEGQVIVHCVLEARPVFNAYARIWPSTFLIPHGSDKKSKLLYTENISLYPEWQSIKMFNSHAFTLVFEGLPKSCTSFDLIEDIPEHGGFITKGITRNSSDVYHVKF